MFNEEPLFFACGDDSLLGVLHHAMGDASANVHRIGVLLVVGGPQYRVGSHRQFVLFARHLAASGIPVFRFDLRGRGDSTGVARDFEQLDDDIAVAIDTFVKFEPGLQKVVLWGLCDAATANAFYGGDDPRVAGQIALNPWARTPEGEAKTLFKHYYPKRALSGSFWRKVMSLRSNFVTAVIDFIGNLRRAWLKKDGSSMIDSGSLSQRFRRAQLAFKGNTLIILSGQDLTAKEYENLVRSSTRWRNWLNGPTVEVLKLNDADHTFSRADWRKAVEQKCSEWILSLTPDTRP